ncbi:MAG: response regulator transcription factor [Anaerolineales bacterium]|nr:response regulator transcription factor [Anaerolineales bacterium]
MIRILLVDDHAILREGLRALLSYYPDVEVVGEAADGAQAIECVARLNPDIVLMDIAMPVMSGLEATRRICAEHPQARVIILTQYEDQPYVVPLLRAGAVGYVLKRALGADLINAIRAVARGESFLYTSVATTVLEHLRQPEASSEGETQTLTSREIGVLRRVARGDTSRQIAIELNLSIKTVEWHRGNIMNKLGARSVAEAVRIAFQSGLLD